MFKQKYMKFSIFETVRSAKGEECTYEKFLAVTESSGLAQLCNEIAAEEDADRRGEMKKKLPIITWQAYFEGKRIAKDAKPSGLFMLDIDHVDNPYQLYQEKMCGSGWLTEHKVVFVAKTASCHGLRVVALCRPEFSSIEENQRWLAAELGVEFDSVCKDFARSSFVTPGGYTYFMDAAAIWQDNMGEGAKYEVNAEKSAAPAAIKTAPAAATDQREGLFGGEDNYRGIPYKDIIDEWFKREGGEPVVGERNSKLYQLAGRLRYICDFNEATMLRIMPRYGLSEEEMRQLIHSSCSGTRAASIPRDVKDIIASLETRKELEGDDDIVEVVSDNKMPTLPPVIRQFVETAPDDFKEAVALCQLPILGALGSKLRCRYLDGKMHSPSFMVSLEAPQASGKSFMMKLASYELSRMMEHDEQQREKEREYDAKVREMKLLNVKINVDNKDEILGSRPNSLIRFVPATMSITKLLMRMNSAQGLHLFALAEEIDSVTKAFKRGFSSYSDLLRVAFDNGLYGQDYASENTFSGIIPIYYNMLTSGTPKAMRRFYPDVEDGLVSRVCFVTLPDQFGKRMPVWEELNAQQKAIVDIGLERLNEVSIIGDEVQPDHVMKMEWLNKELQQWILSQQAEALKNDDRTRDVFCRRSAVVGFRAGMLAFFLYNEKNTPTIRKQVTKFALWVATAMLNQHLLRFNIKNTHSNTNPYEELYNRLDDEFTRIQLEREIRLLGVESPLRTVLYKWRLGGLIKEIENVQALGNTRAGVKFKKIK